MLPTPPSECIHCLPHGSAAVAAASGACIVVVADVVGSPPSASSLAASASASRARPMNTCSSVVMATEYCVISNSSFRDSIMRKAPANMWPMEVTSTTETCNSLIPPASATSSEPCGSFSRRRSPASDRGLWKKMRTWVQKRLTSSAAEPTARMRPRMRMTIFVAKASASSMRCVERSVAWGQARKTFQSWRLLFGSTPVEGSSMIKV
mmetsp:Transcript_89874/g.253467  ORF Transcript_89874/g.253467 Transcript_89874/m.253467 type:complete len:208 (-) Transcript_89874:757-1380(-)